MVAVRIEHLEGKRVYMSKIDAMKVTFLGTGCPIPDLSRSGPSQVIWVKGEPLLFDCGLGTLFQLLKAGIDPSAVKHLFFTHPDSGHLANRRTRTRMSCGVRGRVGRPTLLLDCFRTAISGLSPHLTRHTFLLPFSSLSFWCPFPNGFPMWA